MDTAPHPQPSSPRDPPLVPAPVAAVAVSAASALLPSSRPVSPDLSFADVVLGSLPCPRDPGPAPVLPPLPAPVPVLAPVLAPAAPAPAAVFTRTPGVSKGKNQKHAAQEPPSESRPPAPRGPML
ncbi:hypothetical protein H4217_004385 [Coemansia sp. RSA 1939]|nr:hypothetical protein H4217_004385 [Coemansia sp. RSA 1939]KAJ2615411.1 hypothetical protein EV177_001577 [Coemansia sp. RSA 1804]